MEAICFCYALETAPILLIYSLLTTFVAMAACFANVWARAGVFEAVVLETPPTEGRVVPAIAEIFDETCEAHRCFDVLMLRAAVSF